MEGDPLPVTWRLNWFPPHDKTYTMNALLKVSAKLNVNAVSENIACYRPLNQEAAEKTTEQMQS